MNNSSSRIGLARIGAHPIDLPLPVLATNGYSAPGYGVKSQGLAGAGMAEHILVMARGWTIQAPQ